MVTANEVERKRRQMQTRFGNSVSYNTIAKEVKRTRTHVTAALRGDRTAAPTLKAIWGYLHTLEVDA